MGFKPVCALMSETRSQELGRRLCVWRNETTLNGHVQIFTRVTLLFVSFIVFSG